jgi:hypothetical protein
LPRTSYDDRRSHALSAWPSARAQDQAVAAHFV